MLFCLACCSPLCVFVCYVSVSIGSVFCVCCVSAYCAPLCVLLCVSTVCVLYMCGVYLLLVCVSVLVSCLLCLCVLCTVYCVSVCMCLLYVCVCYSCVYCVCVSVVSLCVPCICLFPCMYVVYVSTVFYVYCICYVYVCFSVVCLCCWLPCWCGVYHGGVMGACFWVWWFCFFGGCGVCGIFLFFYSRFLVGGRLLLGFCYRTFFCGLPWGLCRARNFFKDITHSYCGYVIPVMSLYICLLAHLYHTRYCADTVSVLPFVLVPTFTCVRTCLRLCHPCVLYRVTCHVALACACSMSCVTFRIGCRCLVLGGCAV